MNRWQRARRTGRILALAARLSAEIAWLDRRRRVLPAGEFAALEDRALRRMAVRLRETAIDLQGLLIKLGQFLSTRVDVLPQAFTAELASLRDMVPPVAWEDIRGQLERELGRSQAAVFAEFEPQPVASASLGQVHRATLLAGGPVAVKVQRPGIEELIGVDLAAVRAVCRLASRWTSVDRKVDLMALYGELERTTREELDYVLEAEHAERFGRNFAGQGDIVVPAIRHEWTTRRVLVMDFVSGRRLDDRAGLMAAGIDPLGVAERLVRTYLQQVLRDGFFHADPHPGNIFVGDDGSLVYIDFGMMGQIAPEDRTNFGLLVGGVIRRDFAVMVQAIRDLGFVRPHADAQALQRGLAVAIDLLSGTPIHQPSGVEFEEFLDEMREFLYSQPFQIPTQYAFLGRAIGILLGMTTALDPEIDFVRLLRGNALPYLNLTGDGSGAPGLNWDTVTNEVRATAALLYRLPRRVDRFLEQAEAGELRVRVDLGAVGRRLDDRNRAIERLTRAVLASAAGGMATWLTVAGRTGDARAGWLVTALLLAWTLRGVRHR